MQLTGHHHLIQKTIVSARLRVPVQPTAGAEGEALPPVLPPPAEELGNLLGMTEKSHNGLSSLSAGRARGGTQPGKK